MGQKFDLRQRLNQFVVGRKFGQLGQSLKGLSVDRQPRIRPLTILGALILIAIPTIFTIFPEIGQWPKTLRVLVVFGWVIIAGWTVRASTRREGALDQLVKERTAEQERFRTLATSEILSALLRPGTKGSPESYAWTVYLYDGHKLVPSFPTGTDAALRSFEPSKGATGLAFQEKGPLIVVTDDAVSDDTYGLSKEQQEYFRDHRSVAATPIWFGNRVVGVLTAISKQNDGYFNTGAGGPVIRELADMVGVVLRNIFGMEGVQ